jgi:excisionase family DNA binding protein
VHDKVTLAEAAALLGVSVDTVKRRVHRGELPAAKIGKSYRIDRAALGTSHVSADIREIVTEAFAEVAEQINKLEKAVNSFTAVIK